MSTGWKTRTDAECRICRVNGQSRVLKMQIVEKGKIKTEKHVENETCRKEIFRADYLNELL